MFVETGATGWKGTKAALRVMVSENSEKPWSFCASTLNS
jgi:hypothetical protein